MVQGLLVCLALVSLTTAGRQDGIGQQGGFGQGFEQVGGGIGVGPFSNGVGAGASGFGQQGGFVQKDDFGQVFEKFGGVNKQGPCDPDPCGINANCHAHGEDPICTCPNGYEGVPLYNCNPGSGGPDSLQDLFCFVASGQCFKSLNMRLSWENASKECVRQGLQLPKPKDPISLRSYLVKNIVNSIDTWLGAKGTGGSQKCCQKWTRDGTTMNPSSPLWLSTAGEGLSINCMALVTRPNEMKTAPDRPYYNHRCWSVQWTLCEYSSPDKCPNTQFVEEHVCSTCTDGDSRKRLERVLDFTISRYGQPTTDHAMENATWFDGSYGITYTPSVWEKHISCLSEYVVTWVCFKNESSYWTHCSHLGGSLGACGSQHSLKDGQLFQASIECAV